MKQIKQEDNEIAVYKNNLSPIAEKAVELVIKNDEDMKEASSVLSQLNIFNDKITEERERVTKPLNEALRVERGRWKPLQTMYESAIETLREKISEYGTAQMLKAKAKQDKIAEAVSSGKIEIEKGVAKLSKIVAPEKEFATSDGLVQLREQKVLKITNIDLIPREYFDLNESELLMALKNGKVVAGAELEIKMVAANYR